MYTQISMSCVYACDVMTIIMASILSLTMLVTLYVNETYIIL